MNAEFEIGDDVQTPLGKGVVREVRNRGRLLIDVSGRALEFKASDVTAVAGSRRKTKPPEHVEDVSHRPARAGVPSEIDLHGLTVEQALVRAEDALNDALLADLTQVRFIHGRSGGRIRAALHERLRQISTVRHVLVDPRNDGVTIVEL